MTSGDLSEQLEQAGYTLPQPALELMQGYLAALERDRERLDLTAISTREELVARQVVESLALLHLIDQMATSPPRGGGMREGVTLADLGSGGGVPGIPMAIARPAWQVTLIEGSTRKADWLRETAATLGLDLRVVGERAEDAAHNPEYRAAFDLVVAKAVARLAILVELSLPLLKVGGRLLAQKGSRVGDEVTEAEGLLPALGGKLQGSVPLLDSAELNSVVVVVDKVSPTESRYPRRTAALYRRTQSKSLGA